MNGTRLPALEVIDLVKRFPVTRRGRRAHLTAVDGVSFQVAAGETIAIVGESGSGKSTLLRCIARLIEPTDGDILVGNSELTKVSKRSLWRSYRDLQMVFQDPTTSLNPRMRARAIVEEPLRLHTQLVAQERADVVEGLFDDVRLDRSLLDRFPRQLSGGQRQRLSIARALAVDPRVILLDEPTAALDVSVRAQVLGLLGRLQQSRGMAYVLVSHDLQAVRRLADRVIVMYLGAVVEEGPTEEIFTDPRHPYTRALLAAAPTLTRRPATTRIKLTGETPSPIDLPTGCRLALRCPMAVPACFESAPALVPVSPTHRVACPITADPPTRKEDDTAIEH